MRLSRDPAARRRLAALAGLALAALAVGLVLGGGDEERGAGQDRAQREEKKPKRELPLAQAVGQTLMSSFDGTEVPGYMTRRLAAGQTSGVILFGKNSASEDGLSALTRRLQQASRGGALVAADQEGGLIRSVPFAGPVPAQPGQGDPAGVEAGAREAGRTLRSVGVNVNLAPVADVATGPVLGGRAFAGGPKEVSDRVAAAVRGYRSERVAATAKHFPGLGAAGANTDDEPVTIDAPRATIDERDLPPFRAAVEAGAPLVMSSHALYPALDETRIASQSPAVLEDLLRERLGFRGVVVTDSLEADAVLQRSDVGAAAERSLLGGSDLVLMTGSGSWKLVYPYLLDRARRSPRVRARVREAAGRVLALKRDLGLRSGLPR